MKTATICLFATATLALTACSGSPDPAESVEPTTSATPTVIAEGESSTPEPSVGNTDDPLCAAALQNVEDATALQEKTEELTELMQSSDFLTDDDPTVLNEWGEEMLLLATAGQDFYKVGVAETEGEDVYAYFVTMNDFVETYSKTLAQSAADAESNTEFLTGVSTLFTEAEVVKLGEDAPAAATEIATYLTERCDIQGLG